MTLPRARTHPRRVGAVRRRAVELVTNLRLTGSVVRSHVGEDPLLLIVQVARRLPSPARWALVRTLGGMSPHSGGSARAALAAWVADRPDAVAEQVRIATEGGRGGELMRGVRGRVLAELAGQLGLPAPGAPSEVSVRSAWVRGELTAAVAAAPAESTLAARIGAELAMLQGTARPTIRPQARQGPVRTSTAPGAGPRVLHVLTNSRPHTLSGYTARTHAVLGAQVAAGVHVRAVTRLAYPVSIGRPLARHRDVVDGIAYDRVLPTSMPRTLPERLQRHAEALLPLADAAQVLHATTDVTNAMVTRALAEHLGGPWVYEVRGFLEDTWVARRAALGQPGAESTERYRLLRERETEHLLAADHVVTLSSAMAAELVGRGLPPGRVTVVPNGVPASMLAPGPSPADARRSLGLPDAGFWVGTISSLVDYEGLGTVLEAVAALRERGTDARALVVGDGVARPGLRAHASRLGLAEHAVFPGRVPAARAAAYHRALDVFTVPRRDVRVCRVVTPLKPVEAMAAGRPVVASDLPALREVVAVPGTGVTAPAGDVTAWADALGALADDEDERARLGANGRRFAAGRTWEAAGGAYRALYESLIAG